MRAFRRLVIGVLLAAAAVVAAEMALPVVTQRLVAASVARRFGVDAARVEVRLPSRPALATAVAATVGRVEAVEVVVRDVRYDDLVIDRLVIGLRGVHIDYGALLDRGRSIVRYKQPVALRLEISEASLAAYLARHGRLRDVRVALAPERVRIEGRAQIERLSLAIVLDGRLELRDASRIGFRLERLTAGGFDLPPAIIRQLEQWLTGSGMFEATLPATIQVRALHVETGRLVLVGESSRASER